MKCENIQFNLPVYTDDILTPDERAVIDAHLPRCPLCRQKLSDLQIMRRDLSILSRPPMPENLSASIRNRVSEEIKTKQSSPKSVFTENVRQWLQMRLMPYAVATAISLTFGLTLLWSLLSVANTSQPRAEIAKIEPFAKSSVLIADNHSALPENEFELTAADFAAARISVSGDSPSLNPKGALVALTKSLIRGKMKDDEVVVVADVFGNGLAQISEVVEPSSDRRAVRELQDALQNDSAYAAPFVPANLDGRSETVRVVLKIQRVDIQTHTKKVKN